MLSKPLPSYLHAASPSPLTGKTLCDSLDQSANQFPNREAYVFVKNSTKQRVTFKQLREEALRLAAGFVHLGFKPGQRVGLWSSNCYEWVTSLYAMAYAKLVCIRVRAEYKEEYLEYVINKTQTSALILASDGDQERALLNVCPEIAQATPSITSKLPSLQTVIHLGNEDKPGMIRYADVLTMGDKEDFEYVQDLRQSVRQDDELVMLFTSGSTGLPKVVVKSHRCILENVHALGRHLSEFTTGDVCFLSMSSFAYASGDRSTFMGVSHGFKTVIPDPESGPESWATLISEEKVSVVFLLFNFFLDFLNYAKVQEPDLSSLKYLITAGNFVPAEILEMGRRMIHPNIHTILGSTEMGLMTINRNSEKFEKVGYSLDHNEVKLIGEDGQVVPRGTTGELCVRSPYTMLRYEGDEDKTVAALDKSGWFHTSDLCIMDEDGCLDIVGRKRDIIIKGATNVYPFSVDRVLIRHPKVKLTQTVGVPDERFGEEICACICLEDGEEATIDEIVQFARPLLPDMCVPKHVLFFDAYPADPTGKVIRAELKRMAREMIGK